MLVTKGGLTPMEAIVAGTRDAAAPSEARDGHKYLRRRTFLI
jgi:hypothetical protein